MGMDHLQCRPAFGMAVGPGEIGLHDQAAEVLHQRMANEAQDRAGAERLLVEPRVGIGRRDMRRVRPLLAPEVDFGIAGLAVGAEHWDGLDRDLFGVVFGGAVGSGRVVIRRRDRSLLDLPGFSGERLAHFPGLSLEGDGALEAER